MKTKKIEEKRSEVKRKYIDCAERIIRQEGIKALSIRRLGRELGYNSATMYNYFKDLNELIIYVSLKFRKKYQQDLQHHVTSDLSYFDQYIKLYEVYCVYSFNFPVMVRELYFGPYSDDLSEIFKDYYSLYPEERGKQAYIVEVLLSNFGTYTGDKAIMNVLAESGFIRPEDADFLSTTIVRVHASYMQDLISKPYLSVTMYCSQFMNFLVTLLNKYRI